MSDDENEIEAEDAPKHRHAARIDDDKEMSEAEKLMLEKKQKQEEDEAAKLKEYEEQRRIEREKEEEELRQLKEKQERRRQEREEEERQIAERRQEEEARRKEEEEQRRKKQEAEKAKKDEEKKKRAAMMAGLQIVGVGDLPVSKKSDQTFDKFGNIVKAKAEMGLTKEQHEDKKRAFLHDVLKPLDLPSDIGAVRAKVKDLHHRICRLEADKYDLEQRHQRQEYDLKELNERQRQISRNKALKKGLDPNEAASSRHPPKVSVASKYDRQIDRRSFTERRKLYEIPKAIPHFPNCPPPPQELEKIIKALPKKEGEEEVDEE